MGRWLNRVQATSGSDNATAPDEKNKKTLASHPTEPTKVLL